MKFRFAFSFLVATVFGPIVPLVMASTKDIMTVVHSHCDMLYREEMQRYSKDIAHYRKEVDYQFKVIAKLRKERDAVTARLEEVTGKRVSFKYFDDEIIEEEPEAKSEKKGEKKEDKKEKKEDKKEKRKDEKDSERDQKKGKHEKRYYYYRSSKS